MLIHADFSRRAIVTPNQHQWVPSPMAGVERVMLDRVGEEKARATSIVRYASNSHFPRHHHPGGEEIFVLSGTFSDERIDTSDPANWQRQERREGREGREVCPLFSDTLEQVCLQRLAPGETVLTKSANSAELLVLAGSVVLAGQTCEHGSWIRLPEGEFAQIAASAQGSTVYLKTGHLTQTALMATAALKE